MGETGAPGEPCALEWNRENQVNQVQIGEPSEAVNQVEGGWLKET